MLLAGMGLALTLLTLGRLAVGGYLLALRLLGAEARRDPLALAIAALLAATAEALANGLGRRLFGAPADAGGRRPRRPGSAGRGPPAARCGPRRRSPPRHCWSPSWGAAAAPPPPPTSGNRRGTSGGAPGSSCAPTRPSACSPSTR